MKKYILNFLLALLVSPVYALNPVNGFYAGGTGGVTYAPDIDKFRIPTLQGLTTAPTKQTKLSYTIGGNGGAHLGYRYKHFRGEAEFTYAQTNYHQLKINNTIKLPNNQSGLRGQSTLLNGMLNAFVDLYSLQQYNVEYQLVPYVGAGVGMSQVDNKIRYKTDVIVPDFSNKKKETVHTYQGIIGVNMFLDDYTTIGIDYRYFRTAKLSAFNKPYASHNLNITMNFTFTDGALSLG